MKKIAVTFGVFGLAAILILLVVGSGNYSASNLGVEENVVAAFDGSPRPPLPPVLVADGAPRPPLPPPPPLSGAPTFA